MPRAKLVSIDANIKGERQRFVWQITVRMSVEVPRALSVMRPHPHRIMTKHDSLLSCVDLGEQIPGSKEMLVLARRPVVVAFDKVDGPARQPLSIGGHAVRSSEAEISEEIESIVWLGGCVDALADRFVHLLGVRKGTIAVPNDAEVAEMKVGGEPDAAHGLILVDLDGSSPPIRKHSHQES